MPTTTLAARFWAKVDRCDDGHWVWRGPIDASGRGVFRTRSGDDRYYWPAHRFAWEQEHGSIPEGQLLLNRCGVRRCVNPAHLELGTQTNLDRWSPPARSAWFWSRVDRTGGIDACWPWRGTYSATTGHGQTRWNGRPIGTHVLAWQLHHGRERRLGAFICHHCDNPLCCNPAHMYEGDAESNAADRERRGRSRPRRGTSSPGAKLTAEQVREIRRRHAAGESYPTLGRAFGLHPQNIGRVVRREGYTDVD